MKAKSLRVLLALFLILCPYSLWAYDFAVDNIQYTIVSLDELTAEVSGIIDTNLNELIIPATVEYNGRTLTIVSIADASFKSNTNLQYVSILSNILEIGNSAFEECSSLVEVELPNSVTSIGESSFRNCSSLTSIDLPNSLTSIGESLFYSCSSLTSITIPESVTSIGEMAFLGCTSLTSITIPESVTSIGEMAFYKCTSLTSVTIGSGVTSIGEWAFYKCSSLESIHIPDNVTSIGEKAFYGCTSLTSITIPEGVTRIEWYTFYDCSSLTSVTIPESVTSIGSDAFYGCSSLTSITIPDSVTSIGEKAFSGCKNLENFTIGSGVEYSYESGGSVGLYYPLLWTGAPSQIKKIIISDGLSSFGIRGFSGTTTTTTSNYTHVGRPAFSNIKVEYLYVGRPLVDIKSWAYTKNRDTHTYECTTTQPYGTIDTLEISGYCSDVPYFYQSINNLILGYWIETYDISNIYQDNLKTITCTSTTPPSLSGTFDNRTYIDVTLYVPIGSKEIYQATDGWKSFWDIQEIDVPTSIEKVTNNTESPLITISDGSIIVRGANGAIIQVSNLSGQVIYKGHDSIIPIGKHGIYIVKVNGVTKKILM